MSTVVVDASVAVKWFLPEPDSEQAVVLLDGKHQLLAPDLLWAEFANIAWKQCQRGGITPEEAAEMVDQLLLVPMQIHASNTLVGQAVRLAIETDRTAYDCLYLALAIREGCPLITADKRLVNALSRSKLARHIQLLGTDTAD